MIPYLNLCNVEGWKSEEEGRYLWLFEEVTLRY